MTGTTSSQMSSYISTKTTQSRKSDNMGTRFGGGSTNLSTNHGQPGYCTLISMWSKKSSMAGHETTVILPRAKYCEFESAQIPIMVISELM